MERFEVGDLVWFTKSMRMCEIVEILKDGYIVSVIDSGKKLFTTESGLELIKKKFNLIKNTREIVKCPDCQQEMVLFGHQLDGDYDPNRSRLLL